MTSQDFVLNGWAKAENAVIAPCGCTASGFHYEEPVPGVFPSDGSLRLDSFIDCGQVDECVFRKKVRALSTDRWAHIPYDYELWAWLKDESSALVN